MFLDTNDVTAQELMEQQYDFYKPNALEAAALFKEKELDRKSAALRVRGLRENGSAADSCILGGRRGNAGNKKQMPGGQYAESKGFFYNWLWGIQQWLDLRWERSGDGEKNSACGMPWLAERSIPFIRRLE